MLKGMPFDYDATLADETQYSAEFTRNFIKAELTNGVYPVNYVQSSSNSSTNAIGTCFAVKRATNTSRSLIVSPGAAVIEGLRILNDTEIDVDVPSVSGKAVFDIVLQADFTNQKVTVICQQRDVDTSAARANAMVRTEIKYQLCLATVKTTDRKITYLQDTRLITDRCTDGKPLCGLVSSIYQTDTAAVIKSMNDYINSLGDKISSGNIADNAITTSKIDNSAITSDKIALHAVKGGVNGNIGYKTIDSYNLSDSAVLEENIDDDAVTTSKIADGTIISDKIADNAVTTNKLANSAVTAEKIAYRAVTSNKIGLYAVTGGNNGNIAQNTINNYNLMEGAVQEENIDDGAVVTSKIADGSVTAEKLSDDVKAKIDSNNVVNLGEVNALSTLNGCTDTQKTYFFKVGNSIQGEFEYMTNNAFGILNCYKTLENKYMQTVKIIGNAEFTYKRTYDSEQGSWSEFTYVSDGGYYELDSKIDTLDRFFTADIAQLKADGAVTTSKIADGSVTPEKLSADVKDKINTNTADITQNTTDISQLKSDVLDNAEAITQNTADIEELKAMGLPSVNLSIPGFASTIPDFAFCANLNLVTVTIPSSVKTIGICAFYKCQNLDTVNINKGATSIKQGAFSNCTNLSNITIPDSVTALEWVAFSDCTSLTSVTIPDSVTSVGFSVFERCQKLTNVTIGNKLTVINLGMFRNCTSLTSVTIPDSVTSIGGSAFGGCTRITDVTIPNSITVIASDAFGGCSNLTNVTLGDGFNANNLNLSASTKYTADTIVSWLNALADRTEQEQYTLTIGATNKAKLTDEQLAIATNKNWNIA